MCLLGLAGAQHSQAPRDAGDRAVIIEAYSQTTVAYVKKCTQDDFAETGRVEHRSEPQFLVALAALARPTLMP
jgi:hypothetical protein